MTCTQQQVDHMLCTHLKQREHWAGGGKTLSSRERVILGWICLSRVSAFAGVLLGQSCIPCLRGFKQKAVSEACWSLVKLCPHPAVWKGILYQFLSHHYHLKITQFAWVYAEELTTAVFSQDTHSGGKASWRSCPPLLSSLLWLLIPALGSCLSWASSSAFRLVLKFR